MVHLMRKKRQGRVYLYLEERAWINGKSRRLWQKYLGREDTIREQGISFSPKTVDYQTMAFGASAALFQVARKIGLVEVIDALAGKHRAQNLSLGEYLLLVIINRCVAPTSKSQLGTWFRGDYLATRFPIRPEVLNAQTYWNHFQFLTADNIGQIEAELIKRALKIYALDLSCLLFDPTNFYTFITEHEPRQLPRFGHSKDSRNTLRIINVSLLCTLQCGVPLFHQTYEGNMQDATHFKGVLATLASRFQTIGQEIEHLVLIFDKGNHSPKAFQTIESLPLPFIASLRNSTQKDLLQLPLEEFTGIQLPANGKEVWYYQTRRNIYEFPRTLYVIHDPRKAKRATALFEAQLQKRLTAIQTFLEKVNVKKWRAQAKVEQKLQTLIGKRPFADIIAYTVWGDLGKLQVALQINEEAKASYLGTLGRSILFTSLEDWSAEEVIQAFREKYVVEDAFKQLKNPKYLTIRPMYHWADPCIRAHVFSCVVGLLLWALLRRELRRKSIYLSYQEILGALSELRVTQIYTSSTGPPFYKLNRHSPLAQKLYKVLKLKRWLPK